MPPLYLALGFLATAAPVSAVAARARIPYTVALVVVGLAGGTLHAVPGLSVGPDAITLVVQNRLDQRHDQSRTA